MKPFDQLTLRERCAFERAAGFNIANYRAGISHVKQGASDYDIMFRGQRIGSTSKGWTRLGGAGWVNTYADYANMPQRMSATCKSLEIALNRAADGLMRRDVRIAYEQSPANAQIDNTPPTLNEALDMIKAMVTAQAKADGIPVDEWVQLRPWFKRFIYSGTIRIP